MPVEEIPGKGSKFEGNYLYYLRKLVRDAALQFDNDINIAFMGAKAPEYFICYEVPVSITCQNQSKKADLAQKLSVFFVRHDFIQVPDVNNVGRSSFGPTYKEKRYFSITDKDNKSFTITLLEYVNSSDGKGYKPAKELSLDEYKKIVEQNDTYKYLYNELLPFIGASYIDLLVKVAANSCAQRHVINDNEIINAFNSVFFTVACLNKFAKKFSHDEILPGWRVDSGDTVKLAWNSIATIGIANIHEEVDFEFNYTFGMFDDNPVMTMQRIYFETSSKHPIMRRAIELKDLKQEVIKILQNY